MVYIICNIPGASSGRYIRCLLDIRIWTVTTKKKTACTSISINEKFILIGLTIKKSHKHTYIYIRT